MAKQNIELKFQSDSLFAGQTGVVDRANCIIRGVSVITGGLEAEGHNLQVDDTTLAQLQACAKSRGKIPICLDHGSGVKDINGYLTSFRMDGNQLRSDWHLLKSHDETEKMMERAEVMPDCFGLSTAFRGPPQGVPIGGGKSAARCDKLLSVDVVTRPAANPGGLFSSRSVDTHEMDMAKANTATADPNAANSAATGEPTNAQIMELLGQISERLNQHEQVISGSQEPTLEDLNDMNDEQLAELGLTRAEVNGAIEEAVAAIEAQGDPNANANANTDANAVAANATGADGADTGASSGGADTSAPATFEALSKRIVQLESKLQAKELAEKKAAEAIQMSEIEGKIVKLAEQRDKSNKDVVTLKAENEALRLAVKTGVRPVAAGVDTGVRMFGSDEDGQLHEFQVRVKQLTSEGKTEAEALRFAQKENPQLHAQWVRSLTPKK